MFLVAHYFAFRLSQCSSLGYITHTTYHTSSFKNIVYSSLMEEDQGVQEQDTANILTLKEKVSFLKN